MHVYVHAFLCSWPKSVLAHPYLWPVSWELYWWSNSYILHPIIAIIAVSFGLSNYHVWQASKFVCTLSNPKWTLFTHVLSSLTKMVNSETYSLIYVLKHSMVAVELWHLHTVHMSTYTDMNQTVTEMQCTTLTLYTNIHMRSTCYSLVHHSNISCLLWYQTQIANCNLEEAGSGHCNALKHNVTICEEWKVLK